MLRILNINVLIKNIFIIFFITLLFSCSTIINGSKQQVQFISEPSDAEIIIDGVHIGKTPAMYKLRRGKDHFIEIKKSGYSPYRLTTSKSMSGWFWGNCLCGGIVGMFIDLVSGSAYDIDPTTVTAHLSKNTALNEIYYKNEFNKIIIQDENGLQLTSINIEWVN
jgi:hypothetical protein